MSDNQEMTVEINKSEIQQNQFKFIYVLLPVLISLFIIAYEDFLYNVIVQPFLFLLNSFGFLNLEKGTNEYVLFILLANLILNFASLILIYFAFFKTNLLSKQVEHKQYGLSTTVKTYLSLFALVITIGLIVSTLKTIFFPNVPSTSPYDAILPSNPDYKYYNLFFAIILVCIFAPILEELVFRRILIPFLEGSLFVSTPYAIIVSASVFAFIHSESDLLDGSIYFAIIHFISAFILGLGLASIYTVTRNVKYSMIYHSINNSISMITTIINAYFVTDVNNPPAILGFFGLFILGVIIAGIVFIIIALFNRDKVLYPLINQFKGNLQLIQKIKALAIVLAIQAIIFIIIPFSEGEFFDVFNLGDTSRVIINAALYILIFAFFVLFLRRNLPLVVQFGKVQNNELKTYEKAHYTYYQPSQPYSYPPSNPIYPNNENIPPVGSNTPQFCGNCGTAIPVHDVQFCPNCGFKLN